MANAIFLWSRLSVAAFRQTVSDRKEAMNEARRRRLESVMTRRTRSKALFRLVMASGLRVGLWRLKMADAARTFPNLHSSRGAQIFPGNHNSVFICVAVVDE